MALVKKLPTPGLKENIVSENRLNENITAHLIVVNSEGACLTIFVDSYKKRLQAQGEKYHPCKVCVYKSGVPISVVPNKTFLTM